MNDLSNANDPPVTVAVTRRVKPGCEEAFEAIIKGFVAAAMTFEGHLGVNVLRPTDSSNPKYRIIFKFDRISNLRRWEEAEIRHEWLARAENLTLGPPEIQTLTGLETWFTLLAQRVIVPPPRYKIALLTWLGIFPLITVLVWLLRPIFLNKLHLVLRTLILTAVLVPLMTYSIMPRMTQLFAQWLYPSITQPRGGVGARNRKKRR